MAGPLVPDEYAVPEEFEAGEFRLELLGPRHNEADHAAWTSSIPHIRSTPGFDGGWPPAEGMTLEQNLADLGSHADRSARRVDFAYSVLDRATGEVIGCMYLKPSTVEGEVRALSWVTAHRADLDARLTEVVGEWLVAAWPVGQVHYRRGAEPVVLRAQS
jgi:hypothetical protein